MFSFNPQIPETRFNKAATYTAFTSHVYEIKSS